MATFELRRRRGRDFDEIVEVPEVFEFWGINGKEVVKGRKGEAEISRKEDQVAAANIHSDTLLADNHVHGNHSVINNEYNQEHHLNIGHDSRNDPIFEPPEYMTTESKFFCLVKAL